MEIGRKIYFELNTGNVILVRESRTGSVVDTTKEQDFANYTALTQYQLNAVGEIQLEYGIQAEANLSKYPCRIDIAKNPLDESAIIWDIENPLGASLSEAQTLKIAQINDLYNQKLDAGFTSSATGTPYVFGYSQTDREKFMQLAISVLSNIAAFPVPIPAKDGSIIMHNQAQYQQTLANINAFAWSMQNKLHQFSAQVQACASIDEVNAIIVQF